MGLKICFNRCKIIQINLYIIKLLLICMFGLVRKSKVSELIDKSVKDAAKNYFKGSTNELSRVRRTRDQMTSDWLADEAKKGLIKYISGGKLPPWLEKQVEPDESLLPDKLEDFDIEKIMKLVDSPMAKMAAKIFGFDIDKIKADPQAFLAKFKKSRESGSSQGSSGSSDPEGFI